MKNYVSASIAVALVLFALPDLAHASNSFEQGFCRISKIFITTCHILAIIGLLIFGVMMLLGKGTWGLALLHLVGAAIFAGAGQIADALGASSSCP